MAASDWIAPLAWTLPLAAMVSGSGVLVAEVARRTADGRLGPNQVAGIRTRATMRSVEAWVVAHSAGRRSTLWGARTLMATGPVTLAIATLLGVTAGDGVEAFQVSTSIGLLAGVVLATALITVGARQGHRAASGR